MDRWDKYFFDICNAVAAKSPCLSRQVGVILVRDHSIVSTGYNGPPRGFPHCSSVQAIISARPISATSIAPGKIIRCKGEPQVVTVNSCPRRSKGYKSGEGLHECPAAHGEVNAIINAARLGTSVLGCTMYMNTKEISCKDCMIAIVNAGITELVTLESIPYHEKSLEIADFGNVTLRRFDLE
jgi:dCMP deaminase